MKIFSLTLPAILMTTCLTQVFAQEYTNKTNSNKSIATLDSKEDLDREPPPERIDLTYCEKRGRPQTGEMHRRWSTPIPDPGYSSPQKLQLPSTPGIIHLNFTAGTTTEQKIRFRSQLIQYPAGSYSNYYRYPGYEDNYPILANFNCQGGITYPFHGVNITIEDGDNTSGAMYINGFNILSGPTFYPPYIENASGIYTFSFSPSQAQIGKTYRLYITAQSGVTGVERDYNGIYESDQVRYTVFLHVIGQSNRPPIFASDTPSFLEVPIGGPNPKQISYFFRASDQDNDPIIFSCEFPNNSDSFGILKITPAGYFTWNPSGIYQAEENTVTIVAKDGKGGIARWPLTLMTRLVTRPGKDLD